MRGKKRDGVGLKMPPLTNTAPSLQHKGKKVFPYSENSGNVLIVSYNFNK